jgi:hypothetical protein
MYEEKFGEWVAKIGNLHGSFVHLPIERVPWARLRRPLAESRLALVTTGGVHRRDQTPFDEWNEDGDWSFREISDNTPSDALTISHVHYATRRGRDISASSADWSTTAEGKCRARHFGFMG